MAFPTAIEIEIPLLHLIYTMGGEVRFKDVCDKLADYYNLTEEERQEMLPSGRSRKFDNRVHWARFLLCERGMLDRSVRGVWKITEKGKEELTRLGLIEKPFPISISSRTTSSSNVATEKRSNDEEEILGLVLEEIAPEGSKKFPDDFLNDECSDFYEIDLPGTILRLAPYTQTTIISPKGYFRYQAKNPSVAKYILYAHEQGLKRLKIPKNNLILYKTVTNYEKYCDEIKRRAFELFLDFTCDEDKAEMLTIEIANRLDLRTKRISG